MHLFDTTSVKLKDDETCALLKPHQSNTPPVTHIVNEVINVFSQFPEVKKRVIARLKLSDNLSI